MVQECQDFHEFAATNKQFSRNENGKAVFFNQGNGHSCHERLFCRKCGKVIEIEVSPRLTNNPPPRPVKGFNNDSLKKPIYIRPEKQVVENFS